MTKSQLTKVKSKLTSPGIVQPMHAAFLIHNIRTYIQICVHTIHNNQITIQSFRKLNKKWQKVYGGNVPHLSISLKCTIMGSIAIKVLYAFTIMIFNSTLTYTDTADSIRGLLFIIKIWKYLEVIWVLGKHQVDGDLKCHRKLHVYRVWYHFDDYKRETIIRGRR